MWPANIIALTTFVIFILAGHLFRSKVYFFHFSSTGKAAVPALIAGVALTVIMGLSPQVADGKDPIDPIGFSRMLGFWPFVLTYLWITTIMGFTILRQVTHFVWRRLPSLLCHIGLFLALTAGSLGSADIQKQKMYCMIDTPEWRGIDDHGNATELPIAIELKNFEMSENASHHLKYASDVHVYTKDGQSIMGHIEVNKPLEVNGWTIYQYGYDQSMGTKSRLSIFELVTDPWMPAVYVGIYMMIGGAILLFVTAQRRKEDNL